MIGDGPAELGPQDVSPQKPAEQKHPWYKPWSRERESSKSPVEPQLAAAAEGTFGSVIAKLTESRGEISEDTELASAFLTGRSLAEIAHRCGEIGPQKDLVEIIGIWGRAKPKCTPQSEKASDGSHLVTAESTCDTSEDADALLDLNQQLFAGTYGRNDGVRFSLGDPNDPDGRRKVVMRNGQFSDVLAVGNIFRALAAKAAIEGKLDGDVGKKHFDSLIDHTIGQIGELQESGSLPQFPPDSTLGFMIADVIRARGGAEAAKNNFPFSGGGLSEFGNGARNAIRTARLKDAVRLVAADIQDASFTAAVQKILEDDSLIGDTDVDNAIKLILNSNVGSALIEAVANQKPESLRRPKNNRPAILGDADFTVQMSPGGLEIPITTVGTKLKSHVRKGADDAIPDDNFGKLQFIIDVAMGGIPFITDAAVVTARIGADLGKLGVRIPQLKGIRGRGESVMLAGFETGMRR